MQVKMIVEVFFLLQCTNMVFSACPSLSSSSPTPAPSVNILHQCIDPHVLRTYNITQADLTKFLTLISFYTQLGQNNTLTNFHLLFGPDDNYTNWVNSPDLNTGLAKLAAMRVVLESSNLWDMYVSWYPNASCTSDSYQIRQLDGTCNDVAKPYMGSAGTRLGRNINPMALLKYQHSADALLTPNPRLISLKLFTNKGKTQQVMFLNMLVASWIQFQTHDWFRHQASDGYFAVPLAADDPLAVNGQTTMYISKTKQDPTREPSDTGLPNTFINDATHWWDLDQLYGNQQSVSNSLRSFDKGKMLVDAEGFIPVGPDGIPLVAVNNNWWIGLELMHNIFVKEHNAIAEMLAEKYPDWTDQKLYDTSRMINAALVAKIHTVEWTPAILSNPAIEIGLNSNWYGLSHYMSNVNPAFVPEYLKKVIFGIVGGKRDLKKNPVTREDVPFTITEEFVSVYRMHPLMPETLNLYRINTSEFDVKKVTEMIAQGSYQVHKQYGFDNLLYSFGLNHPGQLTLNNYPAFLQNLKVSTNITIDMGTLEIIRDRERGLPPYNKFRQLLNLKPLGKLEDLTSDTDALAALKEIYGYDDDAINKVDLLVGTLAEEKRPDCYGFGETVFNVFTLMATRRLEADMFYTERYNAQVYTQEGLDWIENNSMKSVLLRHAPSLINTGLNNVNNAFFSWD